MNKQFKPVILFFISTIFSISLANAQYIKPEYKANEVSPHGSIETSWYNLYWFYDVNVGTRLLGSTSNFTDLSAGLNMNAGIGYIFSEKFGLKGRIDHHRFSFTPGIEGAANAKGGAFSLSFEGLTNILSYFQSNRFSNFRLNLHGGAGLTSYANRSYKEFRDELDKPFDDPAIDGNDDMGHIILGLTPQYHINGRCSIQLDFSSFFLIKQDYTFDRYNHEKQQGIGYISALSLGFTFRP